VSIIILFILGIILIGCGSEPTKFPEYWALDYTVEHYNENHEGYEIIAFSIEDLTVYDEEERWSNGYLLVAYKITIISSSREDTVYNVFMAYKPKPFNMFFGGDDIKESDIYDIDIEEA
jgi:hypothetical protein